MVATNGIGMVAIEVSAYLYDMVLVARPILVVVPGWLGSLYGQYIDQIIIPSLYQSSFHPLPNTSSLYYMVLTLVFFMGRPTKIFLSKIAIH